ncbi:hypothetical protein OHB41_21045 [Streptomyces sp. NBC_01571]|uniref:hypothetical protein n=1 Tax=Streptomyces sp. NBC_01571 TaxID=2975883 RepID=UPI00224E3953|nr:hypothetical protein [Streptomyces sp. NBC_01571]MCX4575631.1 hypothetical protein [Streptomyces sp. NBC_01571]
MPLALSPLDLPTYGLVSLGGVTVGLSLLAWDFTRWWASHKKRFAVKSLSALLPQVLCLAYGALLILCAGGIIGALVDWSLWGTNQVGDIVLVYGLGAPAPNVTRAGHLALTPGGHAAVIIITVVITAVCSRRGFRWDFVRQILAGISLGLASSIAGAVGIVVAPTVSWAGDYVMGLL